MISITNNLKHQNKKNIVCRNSYAKQNIKMRNI